jgi:hypothetical protein
MMRLLCDIGLITLLTFLAKKREYKAHFKIRYKQIWVQFFELEYQFECSVFNHMALLG